MSDRLIEGDRFTQVRLRHVYFPLSNISAYIGKKKTRMGTKNIHNKIIFIVCRNKQSRIKGKARPRPFPSDAAPGRKGWAKNKGEFSGQRRTKSDVADNETSAYDQGHS